MKNECDGDFQNTSFKFSGTIPKILSDYINDNELFNKPELLFLEEKYFLEHDRFLDIVDKLSCKKFNSNLKIYKNGKIEKVKDAESLSKEVKLFHNIIFENNINGLNKKDLCISINHFENYEKSSKTEFIKNIYILLFIANITEYDDNNFTFKVRIGNKEAKKNISFNKIENLNLFKFYSWITVSSENVQTRLRIIREIIVRKKSFILSDTDLYSAKSSFNRIIKEETDNYFRQVNTLKDDFLKLNERQKESYQSLHLKFLGWGGSIAVFVYGEIKDRPSGNLWQKILFSKTEKSYIFLIIFLISLLVIWIIFKKEMFDNKKEYEKLKNFYIKQLFFDKDDFSNFIDDFEISKIYTITFRVILIALIIRLFL